jgi:hypothetical protein
MTGDNPAGGDLLRRRGLLRCVPLSLPHLIQDLNKQLDYHSELGVSHGGRWRMARWRDDETASMAPNQLR